MKTYIKKYVVDIVIINLYDKENDEEYKITLPTKMYDKLVKLIKEVENLENKDKELF